MPKNEEREVSVWKVSKALFSFYVTEIIVKVIYVSSAGVDTIPYPESTLDYICGCKPD